MRLSPTVPPITISRRIRLLRQIKCVRRCACVDQIERDCSLSLQPLSCSTVSIMRLASRDARSALRSENRSLEIASSRCSPGTLKSFLLDLRSKQTDRSDSRGIPRIGRSEILRAVTMRRRSDHIGRHVRRKAIALSKPANQRAKAWNVREAWIDQCAVDAIWFANGGPVHSRVVTAV